MNTSNDRDMKIESLDQIRQKLSYESFENFLKQKRAMEEQRAQRVCKNVIPKEFF